MTVIINELEVVVTPSVEGGSAEEPAERPAPPSGGMAAVDLVDVWDWAAERESRLAAD